MHLRSIILIVILCFSCKTKTYEWQILDFGTFKIKTPQGWKIVKEQGIDSYVGGLTNGKDTLWFDYGMYDVELGEADTIAYKFAKDTINGYYARVTVPKIPGRGYISVHIPRVSEDEQFTIWGHDVFQSDTILKMYKSLVFKNSDTTLNPPLSDDKYISLSNGSGKVIFQRNCASCHAIQKVVIGPPLNEIVLMRNTDWIYKFITHRNFDCKDTTHFSVSKRYNYHYPKFPSLTKDDIKLLIDYVKSR